MPTRPDPQITCRDAKNGDRPTMIELNGVSRLIR